MQFFRRNTLKSSGFFPFLVVLFLNIWISGDGFSAQFSEGYLNDPVNVRQFLDSLAMTHDSSAPGFDIDAILKVTRPRWKSVKPGHAVFLPVQFIDFRRTLFEIDMSISPFTLAMTATETDVGREEIVTLFHPKPDIRQQWDGAEFIDGNALKVSSLAGIHLFENGSLGIPHKDYAEKGSDKVESQTHAIDWELGADPERLVHAIELRFLWDGDDLTTRYITMHSHFVSMTYQQIIDGTEIAYVSLRLSPEVTPMHWGAPPFVRRDLDNNWQEAIGLLRNKIGAVMSNSTLQASIGKSLASEQPRVSIALPWQDRPTEMMLGQLKTEQHQFVDLFHPREMVHNCRFGVGSDNRLVPHAIHYQWK